MATESVEVELKAKAGNLQQTLEKMQKTLDKLSSGKHEMNLNTNANDIVKSLNNLDKQLKKLSKNNNLNISLSAGDTLARLKNIDDRLKSINKNSKVNLTATTGGTLNKAVDQADKLNKSLSKIKSKSVTVNVSGANEAINRLTKIKSLLNGIKSKNIKINLDMAGRSRVSSSAVNSSAIKEQYRTLAQEARNYALEAEKAWTMGNTGAFKTYRDSFRAAMSDVANFKRSLGDLSIGSERNIYANMARSIQQNTPLYDDILAKVKSLNEEQKKFNESTGKVRQTATVAKVATPKIDTKAEYSALQARAVESATKFNAAPVGSSDAVRAKKEYEDALNALIKFREAKGSIAYSTIGATYKSIAPKVEKDSAAYKVLQQRINEAKRATSELNGTQINTKSNSANVMSIMEKLQYFIRLLGRSSKGLGSTGEAMSDLFGKLSGSGGAFAVAAKGATIVTAAFAGIGLGLYGVYELFNAAVGVLQTFGNALMTVLKPGYEVFESTTKNILSLSAALQTMGLIDGQTVQPFQAMSAAVNLTNQAMYRAQASAFSYKEVLEGLAGTLPLVLGKGGTAQQALDISTGVAGVAKLTGLNQNQVLQETRDLLQGTITARTSQVANVLGITNDDIAQYEGNIDGLVTFLQSKFNAYRQAMQAYTNTLPGSIEQLQESIGIAGQTVIDKFAPSITAVAQYVTSLLGTWQDANGTIMDSNGQVTDSMGNVYSSIEEANAAGVQFDETTTSFKSSDTLNEFIQMLSKISDFLVLCADEVYNWAEANGYIDDQTPIFESLGNLIMLCLGFVTDLTLAVIDLGTEFAKWGRRAYNVVYGVVTILSTLGKRITSIIFDLKDLASMGKSLIAGDFQGAINIALTGETSGEALKRLSNWDTPILGGDTGYSGYRTSGKFSQMMEEAKSSGKYTKLSDWAKQAKESGINPGAIRGVEKPDDKAAKKAAKEALQEAKRYYKEQQELLKNELEDIKEQIKKELDHVDALYSQGFLTVEDYYKQKTDLEAQQAKADIDYYNKLIDLTNQTPYEHETDRQKELLKLNRELQKATAKLGDIAENQKYIADLTEQSNAIVPELAGSNQQTGTVQQNTGGGNGDLVFNQVEAFRNSSYASQMPLGMSQDELRKVIFESISQGVDVRLALAIASAENGGVMGDTSSAGAIGMYQLMPDTAASLGVDPYSVAGNIKGGIMYIAQQMQEFGGNEEKAIAAYNAGPYAVKKYGGIPPYAETQNYVPKVMNYEKMLEQFGVIDSRTIGKIVQTQAQQTAPAPSSNDTYDKMLNDIATHQYYNNVTSHDQAEQITGLTHETWEKMQLLARALGGEFNVSAGYDPTGQGHSPNSKHYQGIAFDLAGGSMDDAAMRAKAIAMAPYFGLEAHDEYPGGDWAQYAQGANVHFQNTLPDLPVQEYEKQNKWGTSSALSNPILQANSKEQVEARKAIQKRDEDLLKQTQEFNELMSLGAEQEIQTIILKYTDLIDQAKKKAESAKKDPKLDKLANAYLTQVGQLEKLEEVKIREVTEKYNKQYIEYKLKELEEKAQQMADHLGLILEDGTDIFNRALASYTDISSAIEKYGQNYFEGAGAKGTDYETKKVADYVKAIMSSGAKDEAIGYLKNFREVKAVVDGYWASFAKSIKMMTDKVSAYFDHQASLIENNKFITAGQKENLKTKVSQQKAQTLVSAGEATIRQYEMEAGKNQTGIFSLETERAPLQKKVDNKTITKEERAVYDAINSRIADYNNRIIDINNNLIPAIRNEIELNKQLAYMPTLLEQVGMTSKQSLEDGLLTFLTDSVNECKTLGEAFSTLIVGMLKDLQKLFAKKMINDLFGQWFGTDDRSQKSTAKESQFMQQQNPYTNYTNYQLAPIDFDSRLNNPYTLTPPKFSKLSVSPEPNTSYVGGVDTSRTDIVTQQISEDLTTAGQSAQQTAQQMAQSVSQSSETLSTQMNNAANRVSNSANTLVTSFDQLGNKLNSLNIGSSGLTGVLGGLSGGSDDDDSDDVEEDVSDTSASAAELSAQGEENNQQTRQISANTQEISNNTKDTNSDSSNMNESGTPVSEGQSMMMPGQSPMGITGNLTGQYGIGAGIGNTVSTIASPITGIIKTITGEISDFLNAGVFKDLLNSANSVLGSAGAQLAGVGFAIKSFIHGDTKEKLLSLIFIELQLIYQNVVSLLSYVSSNVSALNTMPTSENLGKAYATGGIVTGAGTGTSDSIPAMLSNGEAVITAQRVRQLGAGAIHAINRGDFSTIKARIPHFATGGIVGDGAQNTARGMASFAGNIGANVSTTNQISIGLLRDDGAIIEDWMRSSKGQKHLLDFNRNHANVISKFK